MALVSAIVISQVKSTEKLKTLFKLEMHTQKLQGLPTLLVLFWQMNKSTSYTMGFPPVRILSEWIILRTGRQPMVELFYTTYISVDLAHTGYFVLKLVRGGIIGVILPFLSLLLS